MNPNRKLQRSICAWQSHVWSLARSAAVADPLPVRDIFKFSQQPMDGTIDHQSERTVQRFWGHDELSTAYSTITAADRPDALPRHLHGRRLRRQVQLPVVHVKWWGSYLNNFIVANFPVDKFLISFESDVPAGPNNPFSHPGEPLLNQIVRRGPTVRPAPARSPKSRSAAAARRSARRCTSTTPSCIWAKSFPEAGHRVLAQDRGPGRSAAGNHHRPEPAADVRPALGLAQPRLHDHGSARLDGAGRRSRRAYRRLPSARARRNSGLAFPGRCRDGPHRRRSSVDADGPDHAASGSRPATSRRATAAGRRPAGNRRVLKGPGVRAVHGPRTGRRPTAHRGTNEPRSSFADARTNAKTKAVELVPAGGDG